MEETPAQEPLTQQQLRKAKRPVIYEAGPQGHYGECQRLVNERKGANPEAYSGIWSNINQGLNGQYREVLSTYWMSSLRRIEDDDHNYKEHQLPLARIKKVMKADPEVKMISAEAPILFAKGCDLFITELTMRAWIHAEENKRRTLQISDIAAALTKSDMFDFLIDIVPRDEAAQSQSKRNAPQNQAAPPPSGPPPMPAHGPMSMPAHPTGHHPQVSEFGQYLPPEHDYRPPMYQDQPYGHPQAAMGFDPNPAMYGTYSLPPQQMYQQMPRQDHPNAPPPPQHHYRPHDGGDADGDADGEREYEVG